MDPYIQNNRSYDTDLLILRSLFALNPDTNLPISTNFIMTTDGAGGISWINPIIFGGISLPNLVSTVEGLGSVPYVSTSYLNTALTSSLKGLGTLNYVSTPHLNTALTSTTLGLGTLNYVSTSYLNTALISTLNGLGQAGYVSSSALSRTTSTANAAYTSTQIIMNPANYVSTGALISTVAGLLINPEYVVQNTTLDTSLTSTVFGLGVFGYVSTAAFRLSLTSTVRGLGSAGYVSTSYLVNYVTAALANVGTSGNYISSPTLNLALTSTTVGLGTLKYISTDALQSTTAYFIDPSRYVSTGALQSTTIGILASATTGLTIGTLTTALTSTVTGLGSGGDNGYMSTLSLTSTTKKLTDMITNMTAVTVDRAGNLIIQGGTITIGTMAGSIIYLSTFLQSSVTYKGTNGTMSGTVLPNPTTGTDMMFSTCVVPFNTISSFMNANSRINLDVFPTFAFNELNTMASHSMVTPISTFLQYGSLAPSAQNSNLLQYVNTSYLVANSKTVGFSNYFQQQIKLQIPGSAISGNWTSDYILYHYMPGALTINIDPGLKASSVTVKYSSTNSVFISVQNLP